MKSFRIISNIRHIALVFFCIMTVINISHALEIVRGEAVQGGMMLLKTTPGFTATANDDPIMVNDKGYMVIGFHRDDIEPIIVKSFDGAAFHTRLTITPKQRQYKEQHINGLPKQMVTPPDNVIQRIKNDREMVADARAHATPIAAFMDAFDWPTHGIITGVYGARRILNGEPRAPHYGIDIAAPEGTAVVAPQSGIIRMVKDLYYTGWTIILDHGHGVSSTFLHLANVTVSEGDTVTKGAIIGVVGSTGRSTGPHLDWRINWFDKRLDPALLVGPMPSS